MSHRHTTETMNIYELRKAARGAYAIFVRAQLAENEFRNVRITRDALIELGTNSLCQMTVTTEHFSDGTFDIHIG